MYQTINKVSEIREIRFEDYESVKKRLVVRAVSRKNRILRFRDSPFTECLDFAMICCIDLGFSEGWKRTVRVLKTHLDLWGVSEQKLFDDAVKSGAALLPPFFMPLEKMLGISSGDDSDGPPLLYILTNISRNFGASALFYPGVLGEIHQEIGSFYVLPSSVHELIIVRDSEAFSPDSLGCIVHQVNQTELKDSDYLSDSVYYYGGPSVPLQIV